MVNLTCLFLYLRLPLGRLPNYWVGNAIGGCDSGRSADSPNKKMLTLFSDWTAVVIFMSIFVYVYPICVCLLQTLDSATFITLVIICLRDVAALLMLLQNFLRAKNMTLQKWIYG